MKKLSNTKKSNNENSNLNYINNITIFYNYFYHNPFIIKQSFINIFLFNIIYHIINMIC
jgi:hypothetical protein